ncbi:MAG: sigma-70 family RNA polymerase sigma factor [Verrucomicrobia bacterium]|nr:sigma-70 family RNA polymerase sigma factor [Verrucomicrobiota bacterium]
MEDAELLRRYAEERAEDAFAELVRRHLDRVYTVALRQVGGDAHLAEDVSQRVFADLARKAALLAQRPVLGGWLYRSTQFAATDVVRAERRRRRREQEAETMREITGNGEAAVDWEELRPVLDEVMGELKDDDRDAVWLRYFEGRSLADVGARLRVAENTARMRVDRALEKLHRALAKRGVTSTTAALAAALGGEAVAAAPAGLATAVTGAALAGAAGGSGGVWVAIFTMSKIKTGIVAAVVLAGLATAVVEVRANRELRVELGELRAASEPAATVQKENRELGAELKKMSAANPEVGELARLQARAAVLRARPEGVTDAALQPLTNAGRATPEDAVRTFGWALATGEREVLASFVAFTDDTAEGRAAFMAQFSEGIRARYRTPEAIVAAGLFPAVKIEDPAVALQVSGMEDESRTGQVKLRAWYRTAGGKEGEIREKFQRSLDGWVLGGLKLQDDTLRNLVSARLDPVSGEPKPMAGKK